MLSSSVQDYAANQLKKPSPNKIHKIIFFSTVLTVICYVLSVFCTHLLNRYLSVAAYGEYSAIVNSLRIIAVILLLGSDISLNTFVPQYISTQLWHKAKGYLYFFTKIILSIAVLLLAITAIIALVEMDRKDTIFEYFIQKHAVYKYIWVAAFIALTLFWVRLLTALKKPLHAQIFYDFGSLFFRVAILVILVAYGIKLTVGLSVFAFLSGYILTIALILFSLKFLMPHEIVATEADISEKKQWISTSAQSLIASFFFGNITALLIIINKAFDPLPFNTGALALIGVLAGFFLLPYPVVARIMAPKIRPCLEQKDYHTLQKNVNLSVAYLVLLSICFYVAFVIWGKYILSFFNPEYAAVVKQAKFYLFFTCLSLIGSVVRAIMINSGKEMAIVEIAVVCFLIMSIIGSVLMELDGLWGACIAYALVQVVALIVPSIYVKRKYNIVIFKFKTNE